MVRKSGPRTKVIVCRDNSCQTGIHSSLRQGLFLCFHILIVITVNLVESTNVNGTVVWIGLKLLVTLLSVVSTEKLINFERYLNCCSCFGNIQLYVCDDCSTNYTLCGHC